MFSIFLIIVRGYAVLERHKKCYFKFYLLIALKMRGEDIEGGFTAVL